VTELTRGRAVVLDLAGVTFMSLVVLATSPSARRLAGAMGTTLQLQGPVGPGLTLATLQLLGRSPSTFASAVCTGRASPPIEVDLNQLGRVTDASVTSSTVGCSDRGGPRPSP
jgi:hypothetical protein